MPLISIIVPIYNVEPYLRKCVNSILSQTFGDFELILVDDGSPDGCGAICDEYEEMDRRVRVIHQSNCGLSAARNAGMDICKGKYILFCDSDDSVAPDWCERLMDATLESQDNYIFGRIVKTFDNEENVQTPAVYEGMEAGNDTVAAFLKLHTQSKIGFAWNVLYYADVIRELGLRFSRDVIIEDLPFCLEYLKKMQAITYCDKAHYFYLQRQNSSLSRKYHQDGFRKWREKYAAIQDFICSKIPGDEQTVCMELMAEYYLYFFLSALENTFDKRSNLNFVQKLRYNQRVIRTEEFIHCLRYSEGGNENKHYLQLLKQGNYYAAYLYVLGTKIKAKIRE